MASIADPAPAAPATPRAMLWTGRVLTTLAVLFLTFDTVIKLVDLQVVRDSMARLGYPAELGRVIGVVELVCLILYLVPRTAVLGAVLFTAVMGGAIASHMRLGDPLFSHILFGVYLGAFIWGGLWLRDPRLRALFPLRR